MKSVARLCSVAVVMAMIPASVLADGREIAFVNETGFEIIALYGARKGVEDWGDDLLQGDVIEDRETQIVDFEDGSGYCLFNIKAVFDDGEELISEEINVCDLPMFTYY